MLFGENFRRCHVSHLQRAEILTRRARRDCSERGQCRNSGLAAPDIALKKPRHRMPGLHIGENLRDGAVLRTGHIEGE